MRVSTAILAALGYTAAASAAKACPAPSPDLTKASDDLADWLTGAIDKFFPYQLGWDLAYDKTFSKNLKATFNETEHDFDSFKALYTSLYPQLTLGFGGTFSHGFSDIVAVPGGSDRGGYAAVTGWEGGYLLGDKSKHVNVTDAAYAVIKQQKDCSLKITEFREITTLTAAAAKVRGG